MDTKIKIIGIGMGSENLFTKEAMDAISQTNVFIGAARILEGVRQSCCFPKDALFAACYLPKDVARAVSEHEGKRISILMSGDTGFYSGAKKLLGELKAEAEVLPGISSLSYLASKVSVSWEDAVCISVHGRQANVPYTVRTNHKTFLLTEGKVWGILMSLKEYSLAHTEVYIGNRLSYDDEVIRKIDLENITRDDKVLLEKMEKSKNAIVSMLIVNERFENRMNVPSDDDFLRNTTPMTKAAVRNQIPACFHVKEDDVIYDIGAGTGSVSVLLAKLVPKGRVYAFDCEPEAVKIIEQNKRKFSMDHIVTVLGNAPEVFEQKKELLEKPKAVFIGGTKGNLREILTSLQGENVQVALTALTVETLHLALSCMEEGLILDGDMMQVQMSSLKKLGSYHMLKGENGIYLIWGKIR